MARTKEEVEKDITGMKNRGFDIQTQIGQLNGQAQQLGGQLNQLYAGLNALYQELRALDPPNEKIGG
jgi:hypothetical protein